MAKKILIVEDEPQFHDIYKAMLDDKDYDIISAYDGDEALEKVEEAEQLVLKYGYNFSGKWESEIDKPEKLDFETNKLLEPSISQAK
jgi:CheY-like chemotaxis protein